MFIKLFSKISQRISPTALILILILLLSFPAIINAQPPRPEGFEVMGIGGAGGMYTPASSPDEPDLMFVSCDMSGSYRSLDGGNSWQMIHSTQLNSSRTSKPLFIGDSIYWVSGGQLRMSTNKGENWKPASGGIALLNSSVVRLARIPGSNTVLFAGAGSEVFKSTDGGTSWTSAVK